MLKNKLLGFYKNGNYNVLIYEDGTKIRCQNNDEEFISSFPENIDIKITNRCSQNCLMCHENSNIDGLHGDILNADFIKTLHPYTELAIGGGDPMEHPHLEQFLLILKGLNIIPNITVHQNSFMKNKDKIKIFLKES